MNTKIRWILGGSTVALCSGLAVYYLFIRKKTTSDKYGNKIITKNKSGGISGGVKTSTGGKGSSVSEPNYNNPFDMNYEYDVKKWVSPKGIHVLSDQKAMSLADQLFKAKATSWLGDDDEDAVKRIFQKQVRDKVQVSNISKAFWVKRKKDLWEHLRSFLSDSEMESYVHKPVRSKRNYRLV